MSPVLVLPDAILVVRTWLLTVAEVTALVGTRISTASSASPTYPYVLLQRIGGTAAVRQRLDTARLQYRAWGTDEPNAYLVGRTVLAALLAMEGFSTESATVTGVEEILGLGSFPDTVRTPPTPSYLGEVLVYLHPLP